MDKQVYFEQVELWVNHCYEGALDGIAGKQTRAAREKFAALEKPVLTQPRRLRYMTRDDKRRIMGTAGNEKLMLSVYIPQIDGLECCGAKSRGLVTCYKNFTQELYDIFRDIAAAGLADRLITYDGCYNNRFVRGGNTASMHAYGAAIDLNAAYNEMGRRPARVGERGSVAELVSHFANHGWYWGGNFTRPDGMHFERGIIL